MTLEDIRTKIKLYIGREQALVVQQFQTLERVVSLAFGGEETKKPEFEEVKSKAELKTKFKSMFG